MNGRHLKNEGFLFKRTGPERDDRRRPSDSSGSSSRSSRSTGYRARFAADEEDQDRSGPLDLIADIVTAILAMGCAAGLSTILVVLYVTVRPFSMPVYRRLSAQFGASSFIDALALLLPNTKICLTGDSDVPGPVGTSLLVSNHVVDGDWWAMYMLGRCVGLRGSLKVFLRNEYLHINVENQENQLVNVSSSSLLASALSSATNTANPGATAASNGNGSSQGARPNSSTLTTATPTSNDNGPSTGARPSTSTPSAPKDLSLAAKLLHLFLDFPLINGEDYISRRTELYKLLRSFAENNAASAPVHLLFFPEGWCQHSEVDRRSILAKSNEFARREGRPQLKHLLLPRTRGFRANLECLRESNPIIYDVTMAYSDYDGSLPPSIHLSMMSLWAFLRRKYPREIHVRIKRYSMEEVLQDSSWLDKKWAEKDRLLTHFARYQTFPVEGRGYNRSRVFDSRNYSLENSIVALIRLLLLPCAVPFLLLLSIPLFWTFVWIWLANRVFRFFFPSHDLPSSEGDRSFGSAGGAPPTPESRSAGTPFCPATPFASPSVTSWRDMFSNDDDRSS